MSHGTHMNESWHTYEYTWYRFPLHTCTPTPYEWVMSHMWMSPLMRMKVSCHLTYMNGSCHTCERVLSYICISHVIQMNESCHTHVTHTNESCPSHERVMSPLRIRHITLFTCAPWLIHMCTMTHSHVRIRHITRANMFEVSFAEYSLFYRALFKKRPMIWRSLLIVIWGGNDQ